MTTTPFCRLLPGEWLTTKMLATATDTALKFAVLAECTVSKARVSRMELPHSIVDTPVFMPVGTQGTMKGVTPEQLISPTMDCRILLGNTYHLANRPVMDLL